MPEMALSDTVAGISEGYGKSDLRGTFTAFYGYYIFHRWQGLK